MLETMYAAPGRGLAGPQVGVLRAPLRDGRGVEGRQRPSRWSSSIRTSSGVLTRRANCEPKAACPSPVVTAEVERASEIEVTWRDLDGAQHARRFDGFAADLHPARDRPSRRSRHLRPGCTGGARRAGGGLRAGPRVTVRPFVPYPDRRLATPAAPVAAVTDEIRAIWADMIDTMEAMPGVGLAAPQIGVHAAALPWSMRPTTRGRAMRLANPRDRLRPPPRCASTTRRARTSPASAARLDRPPRVTVAYLDETGAEVERDFEGLWSTSRPAPDRPSRRAALSSTACRS